LTTVKPAWVLSMAILVGWIVGLLGSAARACPPTSLGIGCGGSITDYLAQNNGYVIYYHFYYELGSSIFVTNSALDAAFNILAVLILDRFTPPPFNLTRYFSIFFASALVGNLFTLLLGSFFASAGASGGIFGLYAAVFSFYWMEDKKIDNTMLVLFLLIFLGSSFLVSNVNFVAHFGGALTGFVAGPLLYYALRKKLEVYAPITSSLFASRVIAGALITLFLLGTVLQFAFLFHF